MILRGVRRNTSLPKLLIFSFVAICFLFYIKYLSDNSIVNKLNLNDDSSNNYERLIRKDLAKQVPKLGDNGESVTLSGKEKEIGDKNLATIALNEELSEHLSYNRTTPDARNPLCRDETYDTDSLPTTSVVVIFFNEPYSVLIRTVHSVLNTCNKKFLKEIILVDDDSSNEELRGKLDYYIETRLPPGVVKVVRLKNR